MAAAASYKLTYFGIKGRGETARRIFAAAGQEFQDERIAKDDWAAMKPTTPMGQLPLLTINGDTVLSQSAAIERYLGTVLSLEGQPLYPAEPTTALHCDMVCDALEDVRMPLVKTIRIPAEEQQATRERVVGETLPPLLAALEALVRGPFFCGEAVSVADIKLQAIVDVVGALPHVPDNITADYPGLAGVVERVGALPGVAAWMEAHP